MPPEPGVLWLDPDHEFPLPDYRKTTTSGVYARHQLRCPATRPDGDRCRCQPSFRGRRWDAQSRRMVWSETFGERAEVLTWLAANIKGQDAFQEALDAGLPQFVGTRVGF